MVLYCFLKPKAHRRGMEIYIPIFFSFRKDRKYQSQGTIFYSVALILAQVTDYTNSWCVSWPVKHDSPFCQTISFNGKASMKFCLNHWICIPCKCMNYLKSLSDNFNRRIWLLIWAMCPLGYRSQIRIF